MAKQDTNTKQGFTIIEVVLVLAIAGLIFLMVFVALPALQRSQRDTARRNDLARVDTSTVQYQTNNQGTNGGSNLPTAGHWKSTDSDAFPSECSNNTACKFLRDYMNSGTAGTNKTNEFQDPDGTYYGMQIVNYGDATTNEVKLKYTDGDGYSYDDVEMDHIVYMVTGGQCEGEKVVESSKRHFAILYRLEGAGTYCIDDQ